MYFIRRRYLPIISTIDFFGSAYSKLKRIFVKSKALNKTHVKKIAIFALDLIGDGILATPAIRTVRENFPDAEITIFAGQWNKEIFENNPDIDKVEIINSFWTKSTKLSGWQKIKSFINIYYSVKKENFDLGIDLRGEFLSILLLKKIGAKFTVGYGITGGGWFLDKRAIYKGDRFSKHIVERSLDLLRALDLKISDNLDLAIYPNQKNKETVDKFFADNKISLSDKIIVIHPGSNDQARCWENDKWAKVIQWLIANYPHKIVLSGGPGDKAIIEGIISNFKFQISKFIDCSILDLAELMKRASLVLCVNSASLHIAAAQKVPTVVLFSGSYPKTYGPWQNKKSVVLFKNAKCFPCGKAKCENNICMKEISIEDVIEGIKKLLNC